MKLLLFALFFLISYQEETPSTLTDPLKSLIISKYSHLFSHLIKRIERKIKKIERRKKALIERRRLERFRQPVISPHSFVFGGPIGLGLPFPSFPGFQPQIFHKKHNFHFFRPHPRFHIFKNMSTFSKILTPEGSKGVLNITKEYPGKDGSLIVEHITKNFNDTKNERKNNKDLDSVKDIFEKAPVKEEDE